MDADIPADSRRVVLHRKSVRSVSETTITGKNQVSLPAQRLRDLGWQRGDRLLVARQGDTLVLTRLPTSWTELYAGMFSDVFGTAEKARAYLEGERQAWEQE